MKRKGNLYPAIYDFDNIISAYNEVCVNVKIKLIEKFKIKLIEFYQFF